jgi:tritrans,polycis-undecaprenyl-diphosphate synthase [geranylgeranyl-diphosphate specific]
VILDGNRRFARKLMLKPWKGHEWGAEKVKKLMEWAEECEIEELTLYTLSIENFKTRPKKEMGYLLDLFRTEFDALMKDERFHEEKRIRINFIGRLNMFPDDVKEKMQKLMEMTEDNKPYTVNFAMAYGGRQEVIDAVRKIAEKVKEGKLDVNEVNEEVFSDNLYIKDEPDLIIRTGGTKRLSNFLSYQSAYSELIFIDKMWPEFEKEDFVKCIAEYSERERRFGG